MSLTRGIWYLQRADPANDQQATRCSALQGGCSALQVGISPPNAWRRPCLPSTRRPRERAGSGAALATRTGWGRGARLPGQAPSLPALPARGVGEARGSRAARSLPPLRREGRPRTVRAPPPPRPAVTRLPVRNHVRCSRRRRPGLPAASCCPDAFHGGPVLVVFHP